MNEKRRKNLMILLSAFFLISTFLLIRSVADKAVGKAAYAEAEQIALSQPKETLLPTESPTEPPTEPPTEAEETLPPPTEPEMIWVPVPVEEDPVMEELAQISLETLREKNPDVIGWICIPNSRINYPVVQGEDNQYYLSHTWDNSSNRVGSIFLESTNLPDLTEFHSILYGHNMADGSMFATLHNYAWPDYLKKNPYVYLVTDAGVLRYEVYASYKADVTGDTYLLQMTEQETKESFIRFTCDSSQVDTGIVPAVTDRILTLSTCIGDYSYRRVVHARLAMMETEK